MLSVPSSGTLQRGFVRSSLLCGPVIKRNSCSYPCFAFGDACTEYFGRCPSEIKGPGNNKVVETDETLFTGGGCYEGTVVEKRWR